MSERLPHAEPRTTTDVLPYDQGYVDFILESLPTSDERHRAAVEEQRKIDMMAAYLAARELNVALADDVDALTEQLAESGTDALTGLLLRRPFMNSFESLVSEQQKIIEIGHVDATKLRRGDMEKLGLGLLFLDLDGFKAINDTHGHAAGDGVLELFANVLRRETRDRDLLCRPGGDEFVIAINQGIDETGLQKIAERIIEKTHTITVGEGNELLRLGVSIGGVMHEDGLKPHDMLRTADERMYFAKQHGKNWACVADPANTQT